MIGSQPLIIPHKGVTDEKKLRQNWEALERYINGLSAGGTPAIEWWQIQTSVDLVNNALTTVDWTGASIQSSGGTSVAISGTNLEIVNPGYYILVAYILFDQNANGLLRQVTVSDNFSPSNTIEDDRRPVSGSTTGGEVTYPFTSPSPISPPQILTITGLQDSGATLLGNTAIATIMRVA